MSYIKMDVAGLTDIGKKRQRNEDFYKILIPPAHLPQIAAGILLLVADGMGGMGGGDVASQSAVEEIMRQYYSADSHTTDHQVRLLQALESANAYVRSQADKIGLQRIGSTVAGVVLLPSDEAFIFNVGDSRVYRFRADQLEQLSQDQSVASSTEANSVVEGSPTQLTAFLGQPLTLQPYFHTITTQKEDIFLICSDGLWNFVNNPEITQALQSKSAQLSAQQLIALALQRGAPDNVTVIVARIAPPPRSFLRYWLILLILFTIAIAIGSLVLWRVTLANIPTPTSLLTSIVNQTIKPVGKGTTTPAIISFAVITDTQNPTSTLTLTSTRTPTPTSTNTETVTVTPSNTSTVTPTLTATATPVPSITPLPTSTATFTVSPSSTVILTATTTLTSTSTMPPTVTLISTTVVPVVPTIAPKPLQGLFRVTQDTPLYRIPGILLPDTTILPQGTILIAESHTWYGAYLKDWLLVKVRNKLGQQGWVSVSMLRPYIPPLPTAMVTITPLITVSIEPNTPAQVTMTPSMEN